MQRWGVPRRRRATSRVVPMPGIDKAAGRVVALIVLLILAAVSLRGYLPAAERPARNPAAASPLSAALTVVLLSVALALIAIAFISRLRNRRQVASSIGALATGPAGSRGRTSWQVVLTGLAALLAWLLLVWLLRKAIGQHGLDSLAVRPGEHGATPGAGTPPDPGSGTSRPEAPRSTPGTDMFGYLAAAAGGLLLLIVASMVSPRGRRDNPTSPSPDDEAGTPAGSGAAPETLVRAAELGLAEIGDLSREPRAAIIGCYAAMERELGHVPEAAPQDCDTPTEVLARAVEHHALPAANAAQLVNLFAEARFSRHLMTEAHRQDAIRILRLVLTELRSPV